MCRLIWINLEKRLNKGTIIFIFIAIFFVWFLAIYNADFQLSSFEFISSKKILIKEYIYETNEVVKLIVFFFVIMLNIQEVTNEIDRFDAYFVSRFGKKRIFCAKIISMLFLIFAFMLLLYLGIILIYLFRFYEMNFLKNLFFIFINYLLYFVFIFLIGFILITIFKNYYSLLLIIAMYWFFEVIVDSPFFKIAKHLFLRVEFNIEKCYSNFDLSYTYILWLMIGYCCLAGLIYQKKDLNC